MHSLIKLNFDGVKLNREMIMQVYEGNIDLHKMTSDRIEKLEKADAVR